MYADTNSRRADPATKQIIENVKIFVETCPEDELVSSPDEKSNLVMALWNAGEYLEIDRAWFDK